MLRDPIFTTDLLKYKGTILTKEMLLGRGYCHVKDFKVVEDNFPRIKELSWEVDEEVNLDSEEEDEDEYYIDGNEITCKKVKTYIAEESRSFYSDEPSEFWIKGIPFAPKEVDNQEQYMVLCIENKPAAKGMELAFITVFARLVENNCMFSIPGMATLDSHFFEMEMVPPELVHEVEALVSGRYIPEGFTLFGKPMPENKAVFHPNPPYSLAKNSGWRNVYWHLSIGVDENDKIEDIELSTYEREVSMFQRPRCMDDDMADAFDAALMIVDQYTEEEWNKIKDA